MAVRVSDQQGPVKTRLGSWKQHNGRGNEWKPSLAQRPGSEFYVRRHETGLVMYEVIRLFVRRHGASVRWRQIFEQFDTRPARSPQASDPQTRTENAIQVFLLGTIIFTFPRNLEAQRVAIKFQTGFCVPDNDCGVIHSQEQLRCRLMP